MCVFTLDQASGFERKRREIEMFSHQKETHFVYEKLLHIVTRHDHGGTSVSKSTKYSLT